MTLQIQKLLPLFLMAAFSPRASGREVFAKVTGNENGWPPLFEKDFAAVNSAPETWSFCDENGIASRTGKPVSMTRTDKSFTHFELVGEWMHEKPAPYSAHFGFMDPLAEIPLESAKPFDCDRTAIRHPKETKGHACNATTGAANCRDGADCC